MFADVYRHARVLVTGHTGFKGAWLSRWLLLLGADVTGFSLDVPTTPSLFEAIGLDRRLRDVRGDVRHADALRDLLQDVRPDIVFHLAAQPIVRASYDEPRVTFDTNVTGTLNVLDAIRVTSAVRAAVIVTTDKCYENRGWEFGYRETDRLGGKDPYSASKACAELVTHAYQVSYFGREGAAAVASARAGNVIGGGDWAIDRIVPDCVRAWSAGDAAAIRNPSHVRPWQHVLEPLAGYLLLGQRLLERDPQVVGEPFNFGPSHEECRTVETLVDAMRADWPGAAVTLAPGGMGAKTEATTLRLNCDKAMQRLQWHPVLSFDDTVELTRSWYRRYYSDAGAALETTDGQIRAYHERAVSHRQAWA